MKYLAQHVDAGNDDDDGGGLPSKREKKGKKSLKRGQTKLSFKVRSDFSTFEAFLASMNILTSRLTSFPQKISKIIKFCV